MHSNNNILQMSDPVPMDTSDDGKYCQKCKIYIKVRDGYCMTCWNNSNNINNVNNLEQIWNEFCKSTNLKHTIIQSTTVITNILDKILATNDLAKIFLMLNGFFDSPAIMIYASEYQIYVNSKLSHLDKLHPIFNVLSQAVIDPWNIAASLVPNSISDLTGIWTSNKLSCQKYLGDILVKNCYCGRMLYVRDINISKAPTLCCTSLFSKENNGADLFENKPT
jgi:hypothetical protein